MKLYLVENDELYVQSIGKYAELRKIWCGKDGVILMKGEKVI